jgi:hypothetical protein
LPLKQPVVRQPETNRFFSLFLVVLSIWNNRLSGSLKTTVCSVDRLFFSSTVYFSPAQIS